MCQCLAAISGLVLGITASQKTLSKSKCIAEFPVWPKVFIIYYCVSYSENK